VVLRFVAVASLRVISWAALVKLCGAQTLSRRFFSVGMCFAIQQYHGFIRLHA
jgi:hypothetical protein